MSTSLGLELDFLQRIRAYLPKLPLYLLLCVLPLGVAGQNIGSGVIGAILLVQLCRCRSALPLRALWDEHGVAVASASGYLLMQVVATFLNPDNPIRYRVNYVFGHVLWAFLPPVAYLVVPRLTAGDWRRLFQVLTGVAVVLGLLSLSQSLWGWRIVQTHVEFGFPRAQGLYSHPMSFAYACLVLVPIAVMAVCRYPRSLLAWLLALGILTAILASRSRMVELVTAGVIAWNIWRSTHGRRRLLIMATAALVVAAVLTTNNPIGERFRGTLRRDDVRSDYLDDRVAFWHANLNMVKDRPVFGHGEGLNQAYRAPYYTAIGLEGFIRQYEAHNMFLQVAVNEGLLGLAIFLLWLGDLYGFARRAARAQIWAGAVAAQTVTALVVAALTQNAFQDSAVRFTFTVMIAALWLSVRDRKKGLPGDVPKPGPT